MRKFVLPIGAILVGFFAMALNVTPASAQATRTWVSGVGDDANPCSRTAPCKTFAGSISKTAPGGEINCLDSGGFGALTITKAIAVICDGVLGGVLVSGTNGITINAGVGDVVFLKGLDIEGLGTSPTGISFVAGKGLHVANSLIRGFTTDGISFAPGTVNASLVVQNTIVADNAGGILVGPTGGFTASALITDSKMARNTFGLRVQDNGKATVTRSEASSNTNNGFLAASASLAAEINLRQSIAANNGTNGIATSGGAATIRITEVSIFDNATGINTAAGGNVVSFSPATSSNAGNGTAGGPNGSAIPLQ
jgi:Right handed beta helix region